MPKLTFFLTTPEVRRNACRAIMEAGENHVAEIRPRTRTLDQNALLHSCLSDIAKQLQWPVNGKYEHLSVDEWRAIFAACLHQEMRMAAGIQGGVVMLGQRTRHMTIGKMSELISLIHSFGDARGVSWSPTSLGRM